METTWELSGDKKTIIENMVEKRYYGVQALNNEKTSLLGAMALIDADDGIAAQLYGYTREHGATNLNLLKVKMGERVAEIDTILRLGVR